LELKGISDEKVRYYRFDPITSKRWTVKEQNHMCDLEIPNEEFRCLFGENVEAEYARWSATSLTIPSFFGLYLLGTPSFSQIESIIPQVFKIRSKGNSLSPKDS
jgi:hypothetical protein